MGAALLGNGDGALGAPMVSVTIGGRVHVVYRGIDARIHYRLWNGKHWKPDVTLNSPAAKNHQPHIAAAPQGGVDVVFVGESAGSASYVVYYCARHGKNWSAPLRLSNESYAQLPRLALAPDGVIHVVYNRFGEAFQEIYYTRFDGSVWSAPQVIGSGFYPDIALTADGQAVVAWNNKSKVFYAQRSADGSWSAPQRVRAGSMPQTASLIFDAAGTGHLVAQGRADDAQTLMYAQCPRGGGFARAERVPVGALTFTMYPRLAMDCKGQLRLVYQGKAQANEAWRVFQSIWDGAAWSKPTRLDAPAMDTINQVPDISANGNVVAVTWWARNGPAMEIYAEAQTIECDAPVSMSRALDKPAKPKRKSAPPKPKAKPKPKTTARKPRRKMGANKQKG